MSLAGYLRALRGLLRIPTYLLMVLYTLLGYLAAIYLAQADGGIVYGRAGWLVAAILAIACWYINATTVNDLADVEIDKVNLKNDPDRPLVNGQANQRQLIVIAVGCGLAALALAALLGWAAGVAMFLLLGFNLAYSLAPLKLSARGGLALALLPLGYVALTMLLGAAATGLQFTKLGAGLWLLALCYLQFVARLSLKDYRDVVGDRLHGKRTFLLRHGSSKVILLALVSHGAAGIAGVVWLYPGSVVRAMAFTLLASAAAQFLMRLRQASEWSDQRVWIAAYGRLVSGQVVILLVDGLARAGLMTSAVEQIILVVVTTATFLWSSAQVVRQLHK